MAVADVHLHEICLIKAAVEHPAERIRNGDSGRIGEKLGRRHERSQAGRSYDLGRSSIRAAAYWKDGSSAWVLLEEPHMPPEYVRHDLRHVVTSAKGRSFGLSCVEIVIRLHGIGATL